MKAPLAVLAFALLLPATNALALSPQPSCIPVHTPAYPSPDSAPTIAIWHREDLDQGNRSSSGCTGSSSPIDSRSRLIVTLRGSFHFDGSMSTILARVGAISALRSIQYWSTTDRKWGPFSNDASALTGPDSASRRPDFSASEFVKGAELYYWEDDPHTGPAIYRLHILESTSDRFVISSDNVTPIRRFWLTLFKPGALQSVLTIEHVAPGLFGVFVLNRSGDGASALTAGHESSYVNRATALYRQLAGIKTDQEPPSAP